MQCSPHELKDKLLKALDKDNNVVDMPTVLEVVSRLERCPITREQLESTRIGKYVNEMRRKTDNRDLAKRVKNLVRKWKTLIESPGTSASVNGEGLGVKSGIGPPSHIPPHLTQQHGGSLPASPVSRPGTPSSVKSPGSPAVRVGQDGTCTPSGPSRPNTPSGTTALHQSKLSPKVIYSRPGTPGSSDASFGRVKPASPALRSSPQTYVGGRHSPGLPSRSSHNVSGHKVNHPNTTTPAKQTPDNVPKANASGSKRRRDGLNSGCDIANKKPAHQWESRSEIGSCTSHDRNGRLEHVKLKDQGGTIQTVVNGLVPGYHDGSGDGMLSRGVDPTGERTSARDIAGGSTPNTQTMGISKTPKTPVSLPRTPSQQSLVSKRNIALNQIKCDSIEKGKDKLLPPKTPKVKTTAQLIQEMPDLRVDGSKTVIRIATNQIDKEEDVLNAPVVPPEAKPRPRRAPGTPLAPPNTSAASLSKTKTELVEKFLQSSMPPSSSDLDLSRFDSLNRESPTPADFVDSASNSANVSLHSVESKFGFAEIKKEDVERGNLTALRAAPSIFDQDFLDNPWSLLPQLDPESLDWSADTYPEPERPEVTEAMIDRLHTEHWPGVNGLFDRSEVWHDWTQSISLPSYNGDLLHILPYVNIDD